MKTDLNKGLRSVLIRKIRVNPWPFFSSSRLAKNG